MWKHLTIATAAAAIALAAAPASAQDAAVRAVEPRVHVDVEIDPTAYVLSGYSLHVGLGWKRLRLDLGAFAMAVPSIAQPNRDFDVSFDGFGAKLQYFLLDERRGAFVGVDGGVATQLVERVGTDLGDRDRVVTVGVNAGWRFTFGAHVYATPWLGVGYALGARSTMLGGRTYEPTRVTVFPAVHLGYRF